MICRGLNNCQFIIEDRYGIADEGMTQNASIYSE